MIQFSQQQRQASVHCKSDPLLLAIRCSCHFLYTAISLSEQSKNHSVAEKLRYSSFQRLTSQLKRKNQKLELTQKQVKGNLLAQATPVPALDRSATAAQTGRTPPCGPQVRPLQLQAEHPVPSRRSATICCIHNYFYYQIQSG